MIYNAGRETTIGSDASISAHCPVNGPPYGGEDTNERGLEA